MLLDWLLNLSRREELQKECDIKSLVLSSRSEIDDFLKNKNIGKCRFRKPELEHDCARKGFETGRNVESIKEFIQKQLAKKGE